MKLIIDIPDKIYNILNGDSSWKGLSIDYILNAVKDGTPLELQPNRCDSCIHSEEQDGSNCYECVKGIADNFEAQPTDAVSRTLVHEAITASIAESENPYEMWQRIEALPSVTPERPKGKWIKVITDKDDFGETWHFKCSICGKKSNKGYRPLENYCHNCGADMRGEEDEDSD